MKLIVGLGNPGLEYERSRHNAGFMALDRVARRHAPGATARSKFHGITIEGETGGEKLLLLKPTTLMNRSGQSIAEACRFYKIDLERDVLVLVDDLALACGVIRLRSDGGAGGHNGLIDIERHLATTRYARLRIGVDERGEIPQTAYVLGRFRPDQLEAIDPALDEAVDAVTCWALHGINEAMNRFNRRSTG